MLIVIIYRSRFKRRRSLDVRCTLQVPDHTVLLLPRMNRAQREEEGGEEFKSNPTSLSAAAGL